MLVRDLLGRRVAQRRCHGAGFDDGDAYSDKPVVWTAG
ncbi:hypothetical protein RKD41_002173 [Streptomyces tendae]